MIERSGKTHAWSEGIALSLVSTQPPPLTFLPPN
jgi:hypothetical protein